MKLEKLFLTCIFTCFALFVSAQGIIYVDADASGNNDGTSWQNAYVNLSQAIEAAESGDEVWVAAGIYYPTSQPNYEIGSTDPRFNHFTLKNGVKIMGGFAGDESSLEQRDLEANKTVLSGDIDQNDDIEGEGYVSDHTNVQGENSFKLFYFPEGSKIDTTAVLDGVILTGAVANKDVYPYMGGAAFQCSDASPKVINCAFYGNYAMQAGGAIWINQSSMIIENCTFSGNYAEVHAGAVYFENTSASLKGCNFTNNTAKYGGAVFIEGGQETSVIENSVFDHNNTLTGGNGGGISISKAKVFMKNATFTNNTADSWGGGVVFHANCDVDMVNCIVNGNTAGTYGGGVGVHADNERANVRITNTKIQGNEALGAGGGGISFRKNGDGQLFNTLITGNKAAYETSGIDVIGSSVVDVINATIADNVSGIAAIRVKDADSKINIYNSIIWHSGSDIKYDDAQKVSLQFTRTVDGDPNLETEENNIIEEEPFFLHAPGHGGESHTNGNYALWGNSPLNNKGSNAYLPKDTYDLDNDGDTNESIPYDVSGKERVFAGVVDLGCYEQQIESVSGNKLSLYDDQHVDMGDKLKLNGTDFSIETWIFPRKDAANGNHHNICTNDDDGMANRPPTLYIFQYDRIHYGYGDGSDWNSGDTEKALKIGQWNHIAMTFNDATNTIKVYANGEFLEEMTVAGEVSSTPLKYLNKDKELRAYLDEFRVWKEERTQQELIANMNKTLNGNEENLALYYSFDQVNSGKIEDQAGLNNGTMVNEPGIFTSDAIVTPVLKGVSNVGVDHFTMNWHSIPNASEYYIDVATDPEFKNLVKYSIPANGDTTFNVTGLSRGTVYYYKVTAQNSNDDYSSQYGHIATKLNPPGNTFAFDGATYINATDVTKYEFSGTTIETWVKIDADQLDSKWSLWACNPKDYKNNYVLFYNEGSDQNFSISQFDYDAGSWRTDVFEGSTIAADTWYHIAVVIDKDNNLGKFYLNGNELDSFTPVDYPYPYGSYFSIGQEFDDDGNGNPVASNHIKGSMDEFRIWNKALSQNEIQNNMNTTLRGSEDGLVTYYNFDLQTGNKVIDNANIFDGEVVGTANWIASEVTFDDFTAEPISQTIDGFTLSWASLDGVNDYTVDIATDAKFNNTVVDGASVSGTNSYSATGLTEGSKYYFRVISDQGDTSMVNYTTTLMEVPGNALFFDGKDDYIDISQITELGEKYKATMECWVYLDPTETHGRFIAINTEDGGNKYLLSYQNDKGYVVYNPGSSQKYMASNVHTKGSWVHLAVSFNNSTTKFYLNGDLVSEATGGDSPAIYSGNLISIGQEFDGSKTSDFLKGAIDEVRFWDKTLTQSEIKANMHKKLTGEEADLFAYYDFDQNEGQFVYEKVNGLDGTIIGAPKWSISNAIITPIITHVNEVTPVGATLSWLPVNGSTDYKIEVATDADFSNVVSTINSTENATSYEITGLEEGAVYFIRIASMTNRWSGWSNMEKITTLLAPPGNAYAFDGTNYISLDGITSEDYSNGATVEMWVKPQIHTANRSIIWANNTSTGGNHYVLVYYPNHKVLRLWTDGQGNKDIEVDLNETWNHVAVVLQKNVPSYIYINGKEKLSFTSPLTPLLVNSRFSIGQEWDNDTPSDFYSGAIDEVRIWNTARSLAEIKSSYHNAIAANTPGLVGYFNFDELEGSYVYDVRGSYSGEVIGNTKRVSSKAMITPFTLEATDIHDNGFTANWESIPGASEYVLRVARDAKLTQPLEGMDSIIVGNNTTYDLSGLQQGTAYYYGVMSQTDRPSAFSPASEKTVTTGGTSGELAINLDGDNNYLDLSKHIPRIAGKNTGAITGWFKQSGFGKIIELKGDNDNFMQVFVGDYSSHFDDESFGFRLKRDNTYALYMWVREGHNHFADNNWHHFAIVTGDGNNRILIDGKEQEIFFTYGSTQTQEFSNITNPTSMFIGKDNTVSVDEIAFYKNPLTNAEIRERAHRKLTGEEMGLVAYYNFDNSSVVDNSGLGRDAKKEGIVSYEKANLLITPFTQQPTPGVTLADLNWNTIEGATEYKVDVAHDDLFMDKIADNQSVSTNQYQVTGLDKNGKYYFRVKSKVSGEWSEFSGKQEFYALPGNSFVLDGVDGYLTANSITSKASEEATIECWVKLDGDAGSSESGEADRNVIWSINTSTGGNHYVLVYHPYMEMLALWGPGLDIYDIKLGTGWHHIAVSLRNNEESYIYLDGKQIASFTQNSNAIETGCQFSIGQEWDGSTPSDFYKGEMDEFRIWDIALTEEEIRANMNLSEPKGANEHYIAHFTFDEIHLQTLSDSIIKDRSLQNDGTLIGGANLKKSEGVINPITLEPTDTTPGSFVLNLNDIASAKSYEVEIAYDETFVPPLAKQENIGKKSRYKAEGLCPGVKYYYRVRAIYDENTISAWSAPDTVSTVNQDATIDNLTATQGDYSGELKLSWESQNEYLISAFEIKRRKVGDESFAVLDTLENKSDLYNYTDSTALAGTYYEYTVQGLSYCYDNDTEVDTTNVGFRLPTLAATKDDGRIRLDWEYAEDFARNVEIVRKDVETGIEQVFQEVADSTKYFDTTMELCVPYQYKMIAKTADYGDISTKPVSYTLEEDIFEAIDTLDASKGYKDGKITLNWVAHKQSIIDEYHISRRKYTSGNDWKIVKIIDKGTTQVWIDEDATPGEYYEYLIIGIGSCGEEAILTDSVQSVGFRQPEGILNGQVTYEGGNPVAKVRLTVDYDDSDRTYGSSLLLDGADSLKLKTVEAFTFENGMTVEMWVEPSDINAAGSLFQNSGVSLALDGSGKLVATSGSAVAQYDLAADAMDLWKSGWNHIAFSANEATLRLFVNGNLANEVSAETHLVLDTVNVMGQQYAGYMDEFRLWNTMRSDSLIARCHSLVLPREQDGLISALRFDENLGEFAFDHSRTEEEPNKNHATIYGAEWSKHIASTAKLALGAITEPTGNYQVNGVWFKGSGETFSVTPSFGVHEFDPATRSLLISENSLVYNNQDFTDISAFEVTGNVKYHGADFPVEGVMLSVDGQICVDAEGTPVTTDADGNFTIEVPIGDHFVSVAKMGHTFSEGYFPPKDQNGEVTYHTFNDNVSGIQFVDSTYKIVAGRIVGGTVEGDKKIGFGKSKNNLGVSSFTVEAVKGFPIDGTNKQITVETDPQTGEYEVKLYPEQYSFVQNATNKIGNSEYEFNSIDDLAVLDLTAAPILNEETDTATIMEVTGTDTTYHDTVYTYAYHQKRNWIYRSVPNIEVVNVNGEAFISDSVYKAIDENQDTVDIGLVDADGNHTFGYPVFTKGQTYQTLIKVFEEYVNTDNGDVDRVPVNDGKVTVINGVSNYPAPQEFEISEGTVEYTFYGGFPNPAVDNLNPDLSYTKTFEVHAATGDGGTMQSQWPESEPYRGYVFGGIPTGNNFVTQGPDLVDFILRDPPGSNSRSFFEKGFTVSKTTSNSFSNSEANSAGVNVDLGWKVTTFAGFGAGIIMENEQIANAETGVTKESSYESAHTRTETTTYTKSYSTSDDPLYVGDEGDLFFGHSTNISYGVSNFIEPVVSGTGENEVGSEVNGFRIGLKKAINFGLNYNTDFIYTQNHIENYLIPDLEELRDYHVTNGNQDSSKFYQEQVDHWKKVLGQNEYQKYVALNMPHPEDKNISFDAGAVYEESMTSEITKTQSSTFEFSIDASVASEIGISIGSVGTTWSFSHETSKSQSSSSETSETQSTTVGFTLADGDQGDYFSVDVLKDFYGNGPIFSTKGGQSACPYEGGSTVAYADYYTEGSFGGFVNGLDLDFPTMRIEVPEISAENAIVAGVPDNQPAVFTLKLSNLSEVDADNWFILKVDPASNPYGAKLKMDGASIVNGVAVMVQGGTTLTKTLEFEKGRTDINDYEDVKLILHSQCQFDPTDDQEDIADTLSLSAFFVPTCSDVAITSPADNWLVNTENRDTLPVKIGQYNLQHTRLEKIAFQYRPASASAWTTQAMFFHDTTEYSNYSAEKYKINGSEEINYKWDMRSLQDRDYQIRAVSICTDGSITESVPLTGTLDGVRPQLFGAPSPADGVLDPNDEIMITFNEPIEEGLVSTYNIDVEGVLNGSELNHGTSISFDGASSYLETPAGINLADKSYSLEFWAGKEIGATGTVLAQGLNETQNLAVRFTDTDVQVEVNGSVYSTTNTLDDGSWHHWAVTYDNSSKVLTVYGDDQVLLETTAEPTSASGAFKMGRAANSNSDFFTGKIHDVRIWKRALSFTDIVETMNVQLSGNELGLFANWPMNEGEGSLVKEVVHSRHAENHAQWLVEPASSAYAFNGIDQALIANTGSIPLTKEMDLTIELWFKGNAQGSDAYLISNGNTVMDVCLPEKTMGVKLTADGRIAIESNGTSLASAQSYTDNQWHHMAFVINRRAYATLYIDGEKVNSLPAPDMGAMESAFAYVGALGYVDNAQNHQLSNYFSGNIDEVRIWNTARKQEQIELYQNTRLAGTEAGLMGYFPFETYEEVMGVLVSSTTLEDLSIDPYSSTGSNHCGTLAVVGTESISDIAPNIKRERSKQSVNFDYVINNDKIIITPTDELARIEGCILEITVKNIEDKNGNVLASPATWTAFINKNQIGWSEDYFGFEKEVDQSLSFQTTIKNSSGVVQSFTLSNMPSWLTVTPVSGNISPDDEVTINFEVADGLNIGNYSEDIFLEGASGYNERLTLDLRVYKQAPDWTVDETKYSSSMNVIGQVRVREVFTHDAYDMIAAFAGDECRGVAQMGYQENYDDYFAFLVVYGNMEQQELEYKFWDASEGKIYTDVTPEFSFEPNAIHGNMADPVIFDVGMLENNSMALIEGWKWISFNLDMAMPSVNNVLNGLSPQDGDVVKHDDKFATYDAHTGTWIGSLDVFEIGKLYRIKYSAEDELNYEGAAVAAADYPVELAYGWNRIGYVASQNMTVSEAMAGFEPQLNDVIKGQYQFAMFDGYSWVGSLTYMEPGKGYMYKSFNIDTVSFVYPEQSRLKRGGNISAFDKHLSNKTSAAEFEYPFNIVARVDADVSKGDSILAYINGKLMGKAAIDNQSPYAQFVYLTVFGDNQQLHQTISFTLKTKEGEVAFDKQVAFRGNEVEGTPDEPVVLSLTDDMGMTNQYLRENGIQVYPNPFNEELNLLFYLEQTEEAIISVYNLAGNPVCVLPERMYKKGINAVNLSSYTTNLAAGVYFVKVHTAGNEYIEKIIKK